MLVIVDIDMTIADGFRRAQLAGAEPSRDKEPHAYAVWRDRINRGVEADQPVKCMRELVQALVGAGHHVAYVTARGSDMRSATREWLEANRFPDCMLWMRATAYASSSAKFKEKMIQMLMTSDQEDVLVLDDDERGELAEVCKRRGWTFLRAGYGRAK